MHRTTLMSKILERLLLAHLPPHPEPVERPPVPSGRRGPHVWSGASCYVWQKFSRFLSRFSKYLWRCSCIMKSTGSVANYCLSNAIHGIGQSIKHCPNEYLSLSIASQFLSHLPQIWNVGSHIWQRRVSSMASNTGTIKRTCASIYFRFSSLLGLHPMKKIALMSNISKTMTDTTMGSM